MSEFGCEGKVSRVSPGFGLGQRDYLADLVLLLGLLLLLTILRDFAIVFFLALSRGCTALFSHLSCLLRQRSELVFASLHLSGKALNRLDVVKAEFGHLLARLLHLLDAGGEVAKLAFASQDFESVPDGLMRAW